MRILITGASGFIGSFLAERALAEGMDVWAGVRATSSRRYLDDARLHFTTLNFDDEHSLRSTFEAAKRDFGAWDVIVHAAGVTKSRFKHDFFRVNYDGTRRMVTALRDADAVPRQFVYLSSLSVLGAIRENPVERHSLGVSQEQADRCGALRTSIYSPMMPDDMPVPNTAYGMSKAAAENFLKVTGDFPWVIFRPTGVYGPRETDYFLLAQSISKHMDFAAGLKPQEITFIYVRDLVSAIFSAISLNAVHKTYMLSDGYVYKSSAFSRLLQEYIGVKHLARLTAPLWLLHMICAGGELFSKAAGRAVTLNLDKYKIMKQRNWQCDISDAVKDLSFKPEYDLRRGVEETVAWYKENNLI